MNDYRVKPSSFERYGILVDIFREDLEVVKGYLDEWTRCLDSTANNLCSSEYLSKNDVPSSVAFPGMSSVKKQIDGNTHMLYSCADRTLELAEKLQEGYKILNQLLSRMRKETEHTPEYTAQYNARVAAYEGQYQEQERKAGR